MAKDLAEPRTIHLGCGDKQTRNILETLLVSLNHQMLVSTASGRELIDRSTSHPPDLLIATPYLEDMDGIEALIRIGELEPRPSIVIARSDDLDAVERAMEDHVMAYLVMPVTREDIQPAIYLAERQFEHLQGLRRKVCELETDLENRKIIERAKGIVMKQRGFTETQAHRFLQATSRETRRKLIDIARTIVSAADLVGGAGGQARGDI